MCKKNNSIIILILLTYFFEKIENAEYKFSSEDELLSFLSTEYEYNQTKECNFLNLAGYNYNVNLTDENDDLLTKVTLKNGLSMEYFYKKYFEGLDPNSFNSEILRRQLKSLTRIGDAALPRNDFKKLVQIINSMTAIYGKAKVCPFHKQKCNLKTEGLSQDDLDLIMSNSTNPDELEYLWQAWRIVTGRKVKNSFYDYVKLKNQAAILNRFKDEGDFWRYDYEIPNMEQVMEELWKSLEPLYLELHTYVLRKLSKFYGNKINVTDGLLPAHLTGNNYAQSWEYLNKIVKPFPKAEEIDVTKILKSKNFTILNLFETANEFYTSMGLADMKVAYGPKAMLKKLENREVVCHATAWDMCDSQDFRISMCTEVNKENFRVIHHELGHIQYYIQYSQQPYIFRNSANAGFHEAIGDAIVLSVMNPNHLKKIGLIHSDYKPSYESSINYLMEEALEDIPNFPFTYLVDRWRWDVFKGKVKLDEINLLWWFYRTKIQRVKPPIPRSPLDFDPGSKFHIVGDTEYMPYFIASIIKFQIYKGLCIAAGEFDPIRRKKPLFECDFYGSKAAGEKLKFGLQVGSSIHWSKTLQMISGQSTMDTSAIYDYFQPLIKYLIAENRKYVK